MRDDGWDPLLDEAFSFREKYSILVPNTDDNYVALGRSDVKLLVSKTCLIIELT